MAPASMMPTCIKTIIMRLKAEKREIKDREREREIDRDYPNPHCVDQLILKDTRLLLHNVELWGLKEQ